MVDVSNTRSFDIVQDMMEMATRKRDKINEDTSWSILIHVTFASSSIQANPLTLLSVEKLENIYARHVVIIVKGISFQLFRK